MSVAQRREQMQTAMLICPRQPPSYRVGRREERQVAAVVQVIRDAGLNGKQDGRGAVDRSLTHRHSSSSPFSHSFFLTCTANPVTADRSGVSCSRVTMVGDSSTASISWITPLDAPMSAVTTVAPESAPPETTTVRSGEAASHSSFELSTPFFSLVCPSPPCLDLLTVTSRLPRTDATVPLLISDDRTSFGRT